MKPDRRTLLMIVALAGTLAAVAWVNGSEDDLAAPAAPERAGAARGERGEARGKQELPVLNLAGLDARGLDDMKADLFTTKSWYVPPPPPPPTPPPKPVAPPLPFTFLGRMLDGGVTAVFVTSGGRNQVLHVGDVVDRVWRVDSIDLRRMTLTYLPLNETKFLVLGAGY